MYAIGQLIYGWDIPYEMIKKANNNGITEVLDGVEGYEQYYHGSADIPIIRIGVEVGSIDETQNVDIQKDIIDAFSKHLNMHQLALDAVAHVTKALQDDNAIIFKDVIDYLNNNPAKMLIIWSTS